MTKFSRKRLCFIGLFKIASEFGHLSNHRCGGGLQAEELCFKKQLKL